MGCRACFLGRVTARLRAVRLRGWPPSSVTAAEPGCQPEGGVQPQQRPDHRGLLVSAPADFGQCVAGGAAAAGHFLFGQVQLRDPLIGEVNAVGQPRRPELSYIRPYPSRCTISGTEFSVGICVTPRR